MLKTDTIFFTGTCSEYLLFNFWRKNFDASWARFTTPRIETLFNCSLLLKKEDIDKRWTTFFNFLRKFSRSFENMPKLVKFRTVNFSSPSADMVLVLYKRVKIVPFVYYWYFGRKPQNMLCHVSKIKKTQLFCLSCGLQVKNFHKFLIWKLRYIFIVKQLVKIMYRSFLTRSMSHAK